MNLGKNKLIIGAIIAVASAVLFALLATFNLTDFWQIKFADRLYSTKNPSKDIVIVKLDEKTLDDETGLGKNQFWSRKNYAQLLNNLNKYQPRVVVFDIFFPSKRDVEGDQMFVEALAGTKNPILIFQNNSTLQQENGYILSDSNPGPKFPFEELIKLPNLKLALFNSEPDVDEVVRRYIPGLLNKNRGTFDKNFAFSTAETFLNSDQINEPIKNEKYLIQAGSKKIEVPLENGQMLINYSTAPFSQDRYSSVSFLDVYNNQYTDFDPRDFKDKIVLIGSFYKLHNDMQFAPVDSKTPMYGVEIQANALQTILEQKFLINEPLWAKILVIFVLALGAAFVFMFSKIRWSVLALVGSAVVYTLAAPLAFGRGLILDLVHPYLVLITVFVVAYMYRYVTEFKEKNQLKGAFAKYVNAGVVEQIMAHPEALKLGGENREISILFTDIAHFTSVSEKLKPESLVALLNEYFQAMTDVIMGEGGTLDKFEGDAIMAFFGAPLPQEDHALKACRTALKMRTALTNLLQKWQQDQPLPGGETKPMIDFRCGINTGKAIVGNIGSLDRFNYTVMGDNVNLASRLEGANKKYETHIMVSEKTLEKVEGFFESRELDIIKVVGKNEPIKVYELLAEKGQLTTEAGVLLNQYKIGMDLYHGRKFTEALEKFTEILKVYPDDGPSKLYRQRCEVLRDFPPRVDWDGVFEMGTK